MVCSKTNFRLNLFFLLACLSLFSFYSCKNFLNGEELIEELDAVLEIENAPIISLTVSVANELGSAAPAGKQEYHVGEKFDLIFTPAKEYEFQGWIFLDKQGYERYAALDFDYITEDKTHVKAKFISYSEDYNGGSLIPVCVKRPVVTAQPEYSSAGVNRDSKITMEFNCGIDKSSFFYTDEEIEWLKEIYGNQLRLYSRLYASGYKVYGYSNGRSGTIKYKNLEIVNQNSDNLLSYFSGPVFTSDFTVTYYQNKIATGFIPENTRVYVHLSDETCGLVEGNPVKIQEGGFYFNYLTNVNCDTTIPDLKFLKVANYDISDDDYIPASEDDTPQPVNNYVTITYRASDSVGGVRGLLITESYLEDRDGNKVFSGNVISEHNVNLNDISESEFIAITDYYFNSDENGIIKLTFQVIDVNGNVSPVSDKYTYYFDKKNSVPEINYITQLEYDSNSETGLSASVYLILSDTVKFENLLINDLHIEVKNGSYTWYPDDDEPEYIDSITYWDALADPPVYKTTDAYKYTFSDIVDITGDLLLVTSIFDEYAVNQDTISYLPVACSLISKKTTDDNVYINFVPSGSNNAVLQTGEGLVDRQFYQLTYTNDSTNESWNVATDHTQVPYYETFTSTNGTEVKASLSQIRTVYNCSGFDNCYSYSPRLLIDDYILDMLEEENSSDKVPSIKHLYYSADETDMNDEDFRFGYDKVYIRYDARGKDCFIRYRYYKNEDDFDESNPDENMIGMVNSYENDFYVVSGYYYYFSICMLDEDTGSILEGEGMFMEEFADRKHDYPYSIFDVDFTSKMPEYAILKINNPEMIDFCYLDEEGKLYGVVYTYVTNDISIFSSDTDFFWDEITEGQKITVYYSDFYDEYGNELNPVFEIPLDHCKNGEYVLILAYENVQFGNLNSIGYGFLNTVFDYKPQYTFTPQTDHSGVETTITFDKPRIGKDMYCKYSILEFDENTEQWTGFVGFDPVTGMTYPSTGISGTVTMDSTAVTINTALHKNSMYKLVLESAGTIDNVYGSYTRKGYFYESQPYYFYTGSSEGNSSFHFYNEKGGYVYTDMKCVTHVLYSEKDLGNNYIDWERNGIECCTKVFDVQQNYKIDLDKIPAGSFYKIVTYFANGDISESEVYKK